MLTFCNSYENKTNVIQQNVRKFKVKRLRQKTLAKSKQKNILL